MPIIFIHVVLISHLLFFCTQYGLYFKKRVLRKGFITYGVFGIKNLFKIMMLSWDFRQPSRGRRPMQTPQYLYVHSTTNTFVLFWIESKEVLHFSGAWIYELSVDLLHFSTNVCMCGSVACISGFHVHLWICCIHVLEIMMLFSLDLCLINCKCELSSRTFT